MGDAQSLSLPDLGRSKPSGDRFNGLRLIHTHLRPGGLDDDDLTDLALLRFDLVVAIDSTATGPGALHFAHLLPDNPEKKRFRLIEARDVFHVDFDFAANIRALEREFRRMRRDSGGREKGDRALLVGLRTVDGGSSEATMDELEQLARGAGLDIARRYLQSRRRLDPRTLIGKGKLRELILDSMQLGADMIIFDRSLSPAQTRNIADIAQVEVLDRNHLILALFGQRANTPAGRLQVELASLRYELPRLHTRAEGLSRITGGIGAMGPGETKLEIHRRRVRDRIARLEGEIDRLAMQRQLRRKRREKNSIPLVAIIGYTNSGKSTLLNRMTASEVLAEDRPFATLDPTSRRIGLGSGRELVLTDTVGFIRDLPPELVSAFRATLEELGQADLLLHLVDIGDPNHEAQIESVEKILKSLGIMDLPRMLVFNKCDLLEDAGIEIFEESPAFSTISAAKGNNVERLLGEIVRRLWPEASG